MRTLTALAKDTDEGRKLLYFLRSDLKISNRLLSFLKAHDGIRVNGVHARVDQRLRAGDEIAVTMADLPREGGPAPEALPLAVLFEDDDLLVIDKPAPLACQESPKRPGGTLENRLAARYGADFVYRPVGRLDRGTSGLLAAAKNERAAALMQREMHTEDSLREYLAVVEGNPGPSGVVDAPIAGKGGYGRVIAPEGQPSRTRFATLRTVGARSLVRLRLETGRTHQIRVHMASLGCPVVGDFLYGAEDALLPGRFALHAARLAFRHPETGEAMVFVSPLPEALLRCLERDL